jgi:cell division protein FtsQ
MSAKRTGMIGLTLLLVGALALIVGANAWKTSLKVRRVEVRGNRLVETNEVLQLAQVAVGTPLYEADLTAIQRNVASHHYVKDATVERDLPGTVRVTVHERVPIAIVTRSETVYLDEDGVVLPRSIAKTLFDLPVISGIPAAQAMPLGSRATQDDIAQALEILTALRLLDRDLSHAISEVRLRDGHDIVLFTAEGGVPIIFGRGETASKLVRLETFWKTVVRTRGPQALQYVDLRYDDQVVARWADQPARAAVGRS